MIDREGSRLYDRIMATGVVIPLAENQEAIQRHAELLTQTLEVAQVFDIQNVADYYHSLASTEKLWHESDFPNVAPPFECSFMEFRMRKDWQILAGDNSIYSAGILNYAIDLSAPDAERIRSGFAKEYTDSRWMVESTLFLEDKKWAPMGWSRFLYFVQPDGQIAHNEAYSREGVRGIALADWVDGRYEGRESLSQFLVADVRLLLYPTLLALSFLHCKNVVIKAEDPPVKLSRAFQKRHHVPMVRFHTLNIEPMKTVLEHEGHVGQVGLKRALHIVRGHFADYTERGIFGKYRGIYWFDQHTRGTRDAGIVLKDYNVNPPAQNQ